MRERSRFILILVNETLKLARLRSRVTPQDSTTEAARFAQLNVRQWDGPAVLQPCQRTKLARGHQAICHAHRPGFGCALLDQPQGRRYCPIPVKPRNVGCDIGPLTTGACAGAESGAGMRFSKGGHLRGR